MLTAIIIFFILLFLSVIVYGVYLFVNSRDKFDKRKPLLEFLATFFAIILALFTIQQTNSSIEGSTDDFNRLIGKIENIIGNVSQVKDTVGSVSNKLSPLPNQIYNFSKSIDSLNQVVKNQKENLGKSLSELNSSIGKFKIALDEVIKKMNLRPDLRILYKGQPLNGQKVLVQHLGDSPYIPPFTLDNQGFKEVSLPSINFYSSVDLGLQGYRYKEGHWVDGRDKKDKYPYQYQFVISDGPANDLAAIYPNEKDEIPYINVNVYDKTKPIKCLVEIYYSAEAPVKAEFELVFK